jgi:ribonucleoside-diphosphate reductase alpha chain
MRMLDNVVDINFYASEKARNSNLKHRPVGLGMMAFADCLQLAGIPYNSEQAMDFADKSAEMVSYYAYLASTELAKEKGAYESFSGSLWSKDILPQDSLDELKRQRGESVSSYRSAMDWQLLRDRIKEHGMRNSNCVATAPTATVSNISGVTASIEPVYQNLFVKSNLSGEFVDINKNLVADLKRIGLWDDAMVSDLKYYDGILAAIDRVPQHIKDVYVTAFEIESKWLIEAASRRQRWIDQSQSLNLYISKPSGKVLDETYKLAWYKHLKTTYYLRTLGASGAEKLSGDSTEVQYCSIDNPECEACQ